MFTFCAAALLFAGIIAVICFACSIGLTAFHTASSNITEGTFSYRITEENTESPYFDLDITEEGNYTVICVLMNGNGDYRVRILDDNGNIISEDQIPTGTVRTYTTVKTLEKGSYHITVVNGSHTAGEQPTFRLQVMKT